jgi:hypothetical protein
MKEREKIVKFDNFFLENNKSKKLNIEEESKIENFESSYNNSFECLKESSSIMLKYFIDIISMLNSKLLEKQKNERVTQQNNLKLEQSLKDQILQLSNVINTKNDEIFILENKNYEQNNKIRTLNIELEELHNYIDGRSNKQTDKEKNTNINLNKTRYLKSEKKKSNELIKVIYVLNPNNEMMILKDKIDASKEILNKFHQIIKDLKKENKKLTEEINLVSYSI